MFARFSGPCHYKYVLLLFTASLSKNDEIYIEGLEDYEVTMPAESAEFELGDCSSEEDEELCQFTLAIKPIYSQYKHDKI